MIGRRDGQVVIVLSPNLDQRSRKAAVAHELVHDERRVHGSGLTMEREEAIVRDITARRLVPLDDLEVFLIRQLSVGPVTATMIAEEFDVPEHVAAEACRHLPGRAA